MTASAHAVIFGYHDISDPVKTSGWACADDSSAPVLVHLYARTKAGLRHVDAQWADQYRSDLNGICPSAQHAFRFSDYAAGSGGAALYDAADPVTMEVWVETAHTFERLNGSRRSVSFAPVGIWDPGLANGRWRTDYDDPGEGTHASPLLLGKCVYSTPVSDGYHAFSGGGFDPVHGCRYHSAVSPASNAASSHGEWPAHSFWAVVANVEDAILNPHCTDGPPGQSLPLKKPGEGGVFGIVALPDHEAGRPERLKMHLALNSQHWTSCRSASYGGPYLSFTAQADRGNNGIITYLNRPGSPTTLEFGMTLMDIDNESPERHGAPAGARRYSQSHITIEATWAGHKRWLFIELVPDVRQVPGHAEGWVDVHVRFNWHMHNSMLYPGADYLYKSATVLSSQCAQEGVAIPVFDRAATFVNPATRDKSRRDYRIDLQRVFDCLNRRGDWGSSPMPGHPVPITGITFAMEQDDRFYLNGKFTGVAAPNKLWVAVDSVRVQHAGVVP